MTSDPIINQVDEEWAVETYENGLVVENCHWAETTCEDEEEEDD